MVAEVSDKDINKLAEKMMAQLKTEGDVDAFTKALRKQFWEASLEGEMDEHLGYSKHETAGNGSGNSRNGKTRKRLKSKPLQPLYPILYLDCIVLKIRHNQQVINKSMHLALGVNLEGHKELLGMVASRKRRSQVLALRAHRVKITRAGKMS